MKASKIRELDTNEVAAQLKEQEEQAFRLRLQLGMGQADGLKKYRALRKDRARMLTIQRERALAASK
ncbi:MAG: 50S ribosomal protein L29 [Bryobacterales bacterium]|nr:50S ribosomal protein L29 [Bryobacterales bacterium]